MRASLALLLLLWSATPVQAVSLGVLWTFDCPWRPAPGVFLLTATQANGAQQQFQVRPSAAGACTRLPHGTAEDFCTTLACPVPGSIVAYWVQAVWPEETSGPREVATCWFQPGPAACTCQDPATAIPPMVEPPPLPAPMPPPAAPPPLTTIPPPLPQQTADGLDLRPISDLPLLPSVPPLPTSGEG